MAEKYTTHKIADSNSKKAKELGLTVHAYINNLRSRVEQEKTIEQENQSSRLEKLEGTVSSLAEALKHQRFITDAQAVKIDEQTKMIGTLIELQTKLLNAFGADVEFIQALKKEITE